MIPRAIRVVAGMCLIAAAHSSLAAAMPELPNIQSAVDINGELSEIAWRDALKISLNVETSPGENIPAKVQTTAYLMEDGEYLYVAFDARDPNPDAIRAFLRDRDSAYADDFVGVVLDTFGDERRAFEFFANPLGAQMDLTNDDVNRNEDDSWNAIWDSAGKINAQGFVVEMAIPLNQLRFPRVNGKQTWGIDVLRFYPRATRIRLSNNPLDRALNCYLCQFTRIQGLENVEPGRDLEIVPTITASQNELTDDPGIVPLSGGDFDAQAGLTLRWGITPDITANLAINPDFSQVEADVAQLEVNNQFALFFPESRPFFLEGMDFFNSPIQAVFTRTVADPSVGVKISGRRGDNTFGFYAAEDDVTNLLIPGTFGSDSESIDGGNNAVVGRYSRSFGAASSLGALATVRSGDDYHNYVGGLDSRWRINDQHSIEAQVLFSDTEYPAEIADEFAQPLGRFSGFAGEFRYEYETRNWFANAQMRKIDSGFRADSGFVRRSNFEKQEIGAGRLWHGDEDDWFTRIRLSGNWDITHDDQGRLLERELEAFFTINGAMQSELLIGGLTRDVLFDDILFDEKKVFLSGQIRPIGGLTISLFARVGDQIDFENSVLGDEVLIEPSVAWNINQHLLLRLQSAFVRLDSKDGPNIFDAQLHDVRLTWQFSVRSFIRLTTQFQDVQRNTELFIDEVDARSKDVGRQLLYSYKLNPQTVFFLGYSDQHVDDDSLSSLTTTDRTFFMKIGYAWSP